MFLTTWRTLLVRILPADSLVAFKPLSSEESSASGRLARFRETFVEDLSLFSWADRGEWETLDVDNRGLRRNGDWFRVGFEPMFADYRKFGVWMVLVELVQVLAPSSGLTSSFSCLRSLPRALPRDPLARDAEARGARTVGPCRYRYPAVGAHQAPGMEFVESRPPTTYPLH